MATTLVWERIFKLLHQVTLNEVVIEYVLSEGRNYDKFSSPVAEMSKMWSLEKALDNKRNLAETVGSD